MLGDGSTQIFDDIYDSVNESIVNKMFETIHVYPSRDLVEEEIRRIRKVVPKAREKVQRVRRLKLASEDISELGIQAIGFDEELEEGRIVFIFDSVEHPAEGWGMKSEIIKVDEGLEKHVQNILDAQGINRASWDWSGTSGESTLVVSDAEQAKEIMHVLDASGEIGPTTYDEKTNRISFGVFKQEESKRWVYGTRTDEWYLVGPEDRDYKYGLSQVDKDTLSPEEAKELYLSPQQVESKTDEQQRYDAAQTMKPQEEAEVDPAPDSMEDYSKEDLEKPKSKSQGTDNELKEVPDEALDQEVKYESREPLHLCNACFKTFRSNESKCTECSSEDVEKLVDEDGYQEWADALERTIISAYEKARAAGASREEATKAAVQASKGQADRITVRNVLDMRGVDTADTPKVDEDLESTKKVFKVLYTLDGKEAEARVMAFNEIEARRDVEKRKSGAEVTGVEQIGESKTEEEKQEVSFLKKVFKVNYTLNGKEEEDRVMAFDEFDAKKDIATRKPGAEVTSVEQIGESKVNEGERLFKTRVGSFLEEWFDEFGRDFVGTRQIDISSMMEEDFRGALWEILKERNIGEAKQAEKLTPEQMNALRAPKLTFDYGTVADHRAIMEDLAKTEFFQTRMVGTQVNLVDAKGTAVRYARDEDNEWKPWTSFGFVEESKLEEQDYTVAAKGISDERDAQDIARDKDGQVVPDEDDPDKFQVIVRENRLVTMRKLQVKIIKEDVVLGDIVKIEDLEDNEIVPASRVTSTRDDILGKDTFQVIRTEKGGDTEYHGGTHLFVKEDKNG